MLLTLCFLPFLVKNISEQSGAQLERNSLRHILQNSVSSNCVEQTIYWEIFEPIFHLRVCKPEIWVLSFEETYSLISQVKSLNSQF